MTIIGSDRGEIITFLMDKISITKREVKEYEGQPFQVALHTGPESWCTACRHIKEHNEANTKYLGKLDTPWASAPLMQFTKKNGAL